VPKCLGAKGSCVSGSVRFPVWRHILRSGRVSSNSTVLCWCCLSANNRRQVLSHFTHWRVQVADLCLWVSCAPQGSNETAVCPGKTRTFVRACFAANFAAFVCTLTHGGVVCRTYHASYMLLAVICCCACISYVALSLYFTSSLQCHHCLYTVILCVSVFSDTSEPMLYSSLVAEIARVQAGQDKDKYVELHNDKPLKLAVKVRVPVKEFPKVCIAGFRCVYFRLLTCVIWKEIFFCFQCCCSFVLSLLLVICVTLESRSFLIKVEWSSQN